MWWLDGVIDSMDMSLSKLWQIVKDREAWHAEVHAVGQDWVTEEQLSLNFFLFVVLEAGSVSQALQIRILQEKLGPWQTCLGIWKPGRDSPYLKFLIRQREEEKYADFSLLDLQFLPVPVPASWKPLTSGWAWEVYLQGSSPSSTEQGKKFLVLFFFLPSLLSSIIL